MPYDIPTVATVTSLKQESFIPYAETQDGVRLYYQQGGVAGSPILFIHEFAGDLRSWRPQMEYFGSSHQCIAFNARGYPPSDVPDEVTAYSQSRAVADAADVLRTVQLGPAHVVGLSMGGFCALHLGLTNPELVRSLVVSGCGYGARPDSRESFREECTSIARAFEDEDIGQLAQRYALGPARVQLQNKNLPAWQGFVEQLAEHSPVGMARTMLGVQRERPSLFDLQDQLQALSAPTLILVGDEDDGCLETDLMLKRTIRSAGFVVLPNTGHTCNLEEPELFNRAVDRFLRAVEAGTWPTRDPRAAAGSLMGMVSEEAAMRHRRDQSVDLGVA